MVTCRTHLRMCAMAPGCLNEEKKPRSESAATRTVFLLFPEEEGPDPSGVRPRGGFAHGEGIVT